MISRSIVFIPPLEYEKEDDDLSTYFISNLGLLNDYRTSFPIYLLPLKRPSLFIAIF